MYLFYNTLWNCWLHYQCLKYHPKIFMLFGPEFLRFYFHWCSFFTINFEWQFCRIHKSTLKLISIYELRAFTIRSPRLQFCGECSLVLRVYIFRCLSAFSILFWSNVSQVLLISLRMSPLIVDIWKSIHWIYLYFEYFHYSVHNYIILYVLFLICVPILLKIVLFATTNKSWTNFICSFY